MGAHDRSPLPAPTDFSLPAASDVGTNLSTRTDKTSFSIPDDGREIHISKPRGHSSMSQASLLIEYYEGGKSSKSGGNGRPSVRVKVRPSSKSGMTNLHDSLKITKMSGPDQPIFQRRIPLDGTDTNVQVGGIGSSGLKHDLEAQAVAGSELTQSTGSNLSGRPPVEIEVLKNSSDMSSGYRVMHNASEVSSIPPDSTLDAPLTFKSPQRRRSQSLGREEGRQSGMLAAPIDERSRSLSRERIAQKVAEKLNAREREVTTRRKLQKVRDKGSRELVEDDLKARNRHSSAKSHGDSDIRSLTDSSLLRSKEVDSNISGASKTSNNGKVMQVVEDAIRRLILPEIENIKRNQSLNQRKNRDSFASDTSISRTDPSRRESKYSTTSLSKGRTASRERRREEERASKRRSRGTESERSTDTIDHEKRRLREHERERDTLSRHSHRSHDGTAEGLTAEALEVHNIHDRDLESRERRRRRSKRETVQAGNDDYREAERVPPMPMRSELMDSELTRESILSAETAEDDDSRTERPDDYPRTPLRDVARGNPVAIPLPESRSASRTPAAERVSESRPSTRQTMLRDSSAPRSPAAVSLPESRPTTRQALNRGASSTPTPAGRGQRNASSESVRSDYSIKTRAKNAGLAAAGLSGAALAAVYEHGHRRDTDERDTTSRQSSRASRRPSSGATAIRDTAVKPLIPLHETVSQTRVQQGDERGYFDRSRGSENDAEKIEDNDQFYDEQHQLNESLRSDYDGASNQLLSSSFNADDNSTTARELRDVGATAQVVHIPVGVESAVASLLEPSVLSSERSGPDSARRSGLLSRLDQSNDNSLLSQESPTKQNETFQTEHGNHSRDRWTLLRESARALSSGGPSRDTSPEKPRTPQPASDTSAQQSPDRLSDRPLIDRGGDSEESLRRPQPIQHTQSFPYASDPQAYEQLMAAGHGGFEHQDVSPITGRQFRHAESIKQESEESLDGDQHYPAEENGRQLEQQHDGAAEYRHYSQQRLASVQPPTPINHKDEGYMSGAQNQSHDTLGPLSFNKPPPRLFDDVDLSRPSPAFLETGKAYPHVQAAREVAAAADSPDLDEPSFNPATGTGVNHIESRDIVNLMDHLSARDGKRNARDTEILVTLVRSAAEMRDNFDDMKKFIEKQNQINMQRTDVDAERTINKILSGPRPPPPSGRSLDKARTNSVEYAEPAKKNNIFKRALKGLSGKSTTDLTHIEDMLMQLLDEVEALRDSQGVAQSTPWPAKPKAPSLDSYERLRAARPSVDTYEVDDRVGGRTTPTRTRHTPMDFQTGPARFDPAHNQTSPDKLAHDLDDYDDDEEDRSRTPTQMRPNPLNSHHVGEQYNDEQDRNAMMLAEEKRRKHASNASSTFVPVVSRWSKTTASTSQDNRTSIGQYSVAEQERLRGLVEPRSSSPLMPEQSTTPKISPASDPKYRANRNSLDLQHPQPRQGPTGRHQSNLETEAEVYEPSEDSVILHQSDLFGSNPNLARISGPRLANNATSSNAVPTTFNYPGRFGNVKLDQQHPAHVSTPPQARGQEPLIPSEVNSPESTKSNYARPTTSSYPDPRIPSNARPTSSPSLPDSFNEEDEEAWADSMLPPDQRVGRYQPGELLNPIEERYSLEGDRSSLGYRNSIKSQRGRGSMHEAQMSGDYGTGSRRASQVGMADVKEEDESEVGEALSSARQPVYPTYQTGRLSAERVQDFDDRILTPRASPRLAVGAVNTGRKLTGPRDMPSGGGMSGRGSPVVGASRNGDSPRATAVPADVVPTGPLRGTVRRKPVTAGYR